MTDVAPSYTPNETKILARLLDASEPIAKADLMHGITDNDASFMVMMSRLRAKGFSLPHSPGRGFKATYRLTEREKTKLRSAGF